ncbi:hypothetical protein Tco_1265727 [Tanacetum coccineum]
MEEALTPDLTLLKMIIETIVDYVVDPWVPLILGRPFLRTARALIDVYSEELTRRVDDEAIPFKLGEMYAQDCARILGLFYDWLSHSDFRSDSLTSSPSLLLLRKGDLLLLEKLLNNDPSSTLPPKELHVEELKIVKSSIDDPSKLELKDLHSHLEYAFLEGTNKLPIIIDKNVKENENVRLLKVLKSHKRAIAWKISDIKGIDPQFCTHKILMKDESKLAIQNLKTSEPKNS